MAMVKQVLFRIGEETYGVEVTNVKGIEKYLNIVPIPNAPAYIEGIINLRGDIIPIVSMRVKFNLPKIDVTEETKLIIVKSRDVLIGIEVDSVQEIVELSEEEISKPPVIIKNEMTSYIDKVAHVKDGLVILLDLDGILNSQEQESIEQLLKEI